MNKRKNNSQLSEKKMTNQKILLHKLLSSSMAITSCIIITMLWEDINEKKEFWHIFEGKNKKNTAMILVHWKKF